MNPAQWITDHPILSGTLGFIVAAPLIALVNFGRGWGIVESKIKAGEEKIKRVSERQDKMEQVQRDQHDRLLLIPERLSAIADAIENLKERIDE